MNIPILIVEVITGSRDKIVFLPFAPSALPSCRSHMATCSRVGVRNETGETWPDIFPIFGSGIGADPVPDIVPVTERLVSSSI